MLLQAASQGGKDRVGTGHLVMKNGDFSRYTALPAGPGQCAGRAGGIGEGHVKEGAKDADEIEVTSFCGAAAFLFLDILFFAAFSVAQRCFHCDGDPQGLVG